MLATVLDTITVPGLAALAVAIVTLAGQTWMVAKIRESQKEQQRWQGLKRERGVAIADFLTDWIAPWYDASKRDDVHMLEVQRKYWELTLWLDAATLRTLNKALSSEGDPIEALAAVRQAIVGLDEFVPAVEFIRWEPGSGDRWERRMATTVDDTETSKTPLDEAPPVSGLEPPA